MDWLEIRTKYPNAFMKCGQNIWLPDRSLYDFFDEQGIYITIQSKLTYDDLDLTFDWEISAMGRLGVEKNNYVLVSRIQAEEQAFIKAFEILEGKL